jgi:hypothetical protein
MSQPAPIQLPTPSGAEPARDAPEPSLPGWRGVRDELAQMIADACPPAIEPVPFVRPIARHRPS